MPDPGFRLLELDLASGEHALRRLTADDLRAHIGGASLGAALLYPHLTPDLDPLAPAAPLLLMTGPLTGTTGPSVGRAVFCGKSPATGLWAESNIGGRLGAELRAAGYDGLSLRGAAPEPCVLSIRDGAVALRPATALWGRADTYQTQDEVRRLLGEPRACVAAIGAAGERLLPMAAVLCDHGRLAGRTGLGAVMGAKRLKALAVRGTRPIPLARPEAYAALRRRVNIELREDNISRTMRELGTASGVDYWSYLGSMATYAFTRGAFATAERVSGSTMAETILTGASTCHGCVIACGRVVQLEGGPRAKGPEYETTIGFGPLLGIDDLAAITRLGNLCDAYGIDTISLATTIALAFLLFERGVLGPADTGGLRLEWGDAGAAEALVHQTVRQEGFGSRLAQGSRALAREVGHPEWAAQVNGLEVAYHDPRGASGMALIYATSPRGACHNQGDYYFVDTLGRSDDDFEVEAFPRHAGAEKAVSVARNQDWTTVRNALVMCIFANVAPSVVAELLSHASGLDYALADLRVIGERSWNLKRAINNRLGLTRANDRLPRHLLEPLTEGGSAGYVPPLEEMLEAYYAARGWDRASGRPTRATLERLGLKQAAQDLWPLAHRALAAD